MNRKRRRKRIHLLQQFQQITVFEQRIQLHIIQLFSDYLFLDYHIRIEITLFT